MLRIDKNKCLKAYDDYANNFKPFSNGDKLKIKHTKFVAQNCVLLAKKLCPEFVDLAWLIGLLHDLGRFEQLQKYHSFKDDKTVDHADLCVEILFERGLINDFAACFTGSAMDIEQAKNAIKLSIFNHNKIEIQPGLTGINLTLCKIIRDADKLDIFRVCATDDLSVVYGGTKFEIERSVISKKIYDIAIKQVAVPYVLRESLADDVVSHLNFIYDINYDYSLAVANNQGYFNMMKNFEFSDTQSQKYFVEICNKLPI